jgi:hypothetical protein
MSQPTSFHNQAPPEFDPLSSQEQLFQAIETHPGIEHFTLQAPESIPEDVQRYFPVNYRNQWVSIKEEAFGDPMARHESAELDQSLVGIVKAGRELFGIVRADLKRPHEYPDHHVTPNRKTDMLVQLSGGGVNQNRVIGLIGEYNGHKQLEVGRNLIPDLGGHTSRRHFRIDVRGESMVFDGTEAYPHYEISDLGSSNGTEVLSGRTGVTLSNEAQLKSNRSKFGLQAVKKAVKRKKQPEVGVTNPLDSPDTWTVTPDQVEKAFAERDQLRHRRMARLQ